MKKSTIIGIIAVIVFLAGGTYLYLNYYGNNSANQIITVQGTNTSSTAQTQTASATPLLSVSANMSLGSYLVAPNGMTLYLYTKDSPGVSNCYGQCAVIWPPYTITASAGLAAATGVTGMLAAVTRTDGTIQLTYKGSPLYYYSKDAKPGDVNGQGVGGVWYVVTP